MTTLRWEDSAEWRTPAPTWCCVKCGRPWYGDGAERMARFCCSTDKQCASCGERQPTRGYCYPCRMRREQEGWRALPRVDSWTFPLCTFDNRYIFDECDLDGALDLSADTTVEAATLAIEGAMLTTCVRSLPPRIEVRELLSDWLPDDVDIDTSEIDGKIEEWMSKNAPTLYESASEVPTTESVMRAIGLAVEGKP